MRSIFALILVAALLAAPATVYAAAFQPQETQPPAPAQPQTQQPAQKPAQSQLMFTADAGMIFNIIKPEKTADFEMIINKVKEALTKSTDANRRQQAAGWKVFKSVEGGPNGTALYIFIMDPTVKGTEYDIFKIISEAFPSEALELYNKAKDAYVSQNRVGLQLVTEFKGAPATPGGQQ